MKKHYAFTLVELAIVVSIIAILVASISVANKLVRQTQLQKLVDDINKYQAAMQNFRLSYNSLPGDMSNASSYWDGATDGNGDGILLWNTDGANSFIHLSLAEIVPAELTAYVYNASSNPFVKVGIHIPETDINGVGIGTWYCSSATCSSHEFIDIGNNLLIGATSTAQNNGGAITGTENYLLDKKIDDGLPGKGSVRNINASCVSGEGSDPWDKDGVTYDRNYIENGCAFYIELLAK